jgi:hypothetical protein
MLTLFRTYNLAFVLIGVLAFSIVAIAEAASAPSQIPITVTVTALGPNFSSAPEIPKEDVTAFSGSNRLNVTRWVRAQGSDANLQLAVLIDNDLGTAMVGRSEQDLQNFINAQPPTTSVGVFYAQNGAATPMASFTTDRAQASNAIRLTLGRQGDSPSIYLSLADLAQHWPSTTPARREALVLASGFDPLYPGIEDPYADAATNAVEKAGIDVHLILIPRGRYADTFRDNISEGKLMQASTGTGGQDLFDGAFVPVSLSPFLKNLNAALDNQYLLTFEIDRSNKKGGELKPLRVRTEESGVKLYAPQQVLVPGS